MAEKKDNIQDIIQYYSSNGEDERHQRHQLEFALMSRALTAYLSDKPRKILELGAGSGVYTEFLAQMGHEVVALEPTQSLVSQNQKRIRSKKLEDRVSWVQADARDLSSSLNEEQKRDQFDVVLNMGPFYHLIEKVDREGLMKESMGLLKPEGLHLAVFLSKSGYATYLLKRQPENLFEDPDGFRDIMTQGYFSRHPRNGIFRGHFTDLGEVSELHQNCDALIQRFHVLDPCIGADDDIYNQLSSEQKTIWAEVLFALSSDPGYWSSGRTWLAVSQHLKK